MRILANLNVAGTLDIDTVTNAGADTDRFLVQDATGLVRYRTGAEVASDIGAAIGYVSTVKHLVKLGENISKGQAVYVSSSDGTNMIVMKASNASEATSSKTLGLLETGGVTNDQVYVVTEGLLAGLNTSTANAGDPVWLGTDGNLIFGLANKPYAPAHMVFIGIVTRVQQNNGEIFVKVQNGFELQELHNVQITSTPADNTVLSYETSSSLYKMKSIPTLLGFTPFANPMTTLGDTMYGGASGVATRLAGNTTTTKQYLSQTGTGSASAAPIWASFNVDARAAISLTTNGTSGVATYDNSTGVLNIPNYVGSTGIRLVYSFTATASQTTFTVTSYTPGLIDVFYNGSRLNESEYTATNGTTIVLNIACKVNDIVDIVVYQGNITGLSGVAGAGTANQITYWTGTNTIGALSTSTYPSLTELSYVKGVTSSIQAQLDAKQPLFGNQNANLVYAGPTNGAAASPTFRSLVNADLPDSGVTAGTYNDSATQVKPFTVNAKGLITGVGGAVTITPAWSSITSKPTTISGFGITDAYTKTEVDSFLQGLDPKASVKAATTGTITLSGEQTIDDIAVVAGDRVLVKDQSTQTANGIYVVSASGWSRSSDMDANSEFPGAYVFVERGTANADKGFVCTNDTVSLGSTNITFAQFSGTGAYQAVLNGTGFVRMTGTSVSYITGTSSQFVKADGTLDSSTYVTGGPYLPLAGGTLTNTGGDGTPILTLSGSSNDGFQWMTFASNSTLAAGKNVGYWIGKAKSTKNSGVFGFQWNSDGGDDNFITIGFYAADHRLKIFPNGNATLLGALTASNFSGSSSGTNTGDQTTITGNAGSATVLQTARNFTINGTAKSFDGSAAVSWTAAEIGLTSYLPLAGGAMTGRFTMSNTNSTYTDPATTNVPSIYIYNTNDASTSAHSILALRTNNADGGDPFVSWDIGGVIGWSAGIDNSDGDKFKIANTWSALDSSTRFTIDGYGNIGVGTSTPNGSATERTIVLANNTATYYLTNGANTLRGIFALGNSTSEVFIGTQTDHNFHLRTNDTSRLWITNKGNVGIGTTFVLGSYLSSVNQSGVFQTATNVAKSATASDNILAFFGSNDAVNPLGLFVGMQTGATAASRVVRLQGTEIGASANHILIQPDGAYVGMGQYFTSATFNVPTVLLHISNSNSSYTSPSSNNLPSIYVHNRNNASTDAHAILALRTAGDSATSTSASGNPFISFDIENVTGWAMGVDNADGDSFKLNHGWNSLTSNTAFRVATTTKNITFYGALSGTSATFSGNVRKTGAAGVYTELQYDGIYATGTDLYLLAPSTKGVYIYTNNTQALSISSTGAASFSSSVGINTAPSYRLHILNAADAHITRFTGGTSSNIHIGIFATNEYGFGSIGTQSNHAFNIYTNDTDRFLISNSGQATFKGSVNIASISTGNSNTLYFGDEVQRSSGKCIFMESYYLKIQGHRNEGVILQGTDGNSNIQTFASFYGSNNGSFPSTALLYPAGGRVAIGTTSPLGDGSSERTLHLAAAASANATFYITNSANTLKGIFAIGSASSSIAIGSQSNHNFKIVTNDIERIYVTSDGRLGVGTTFVIGSYMDSASQTGVIQQATNIAKASTARDVPLAYFGSNDASYPLGLYIGMRTGATTAARQLKLQGTEIGLSPNHILLQPDGANIGLGTHFGTVSNSPTVLLHISNGNNGFTSPDSNNIPCIYLNNTNGSSTSAHSLLVLRTNNAGGGNPFISFDINGVTGWSMGVDNADSDSFKLNWGWNSLTSNTALRFATSTLNATFTGSITASSFFEPSDIRLKDIIERNPSVSLNIDLVKYKKKDKDGIRYGYIAQEVKALIPELAEGDDILSLNYQDIHSIKIAALEAKIKELESKLNNK